MCSCTLRLSWLLSIYDPLERPLCFTARSAYLSNRRLNHWALRPIFAEFGQSPPNTIGGLKQNTGFGGEACLGRYSRNWRATNKNQYDENAAAHTSKI